MARYHSAQTGLGGDLRMPGHLCDDRHVGPRVEHVTDERAAHDLRGKRRRRRLAPRCELASCVLSAQPERWASMRVTASPRRSPCSASKGPSAG